jgi:gamma-glutamyltranspeptidase/glutathione hydrolase
MMSGTPYLIRLLLLAILASLRLLRRRNATPERRFTPGVTRASALLALLLLSAACASPVRPGPAGGRTPPSLGGVASAELDGTRAGVAILRRGGNAIDAAVAVALALAVVHPQAGNLGGGGFALVRAEDGLHALDFRETAPAAARPGMYLDGGGNPVPEASIVGPLAAGVPGSPAGLFELHRRFGRLPWAEVVAPSVRLARDGFVVTPRLHEAIDWEKELLSRFPETAAVFLPGGAPPPPGTMLRLPELASTLEAYAARGPGAIVTGPVAAAVERVARAHGGVLGAADLAAYRPEWRRPLLLRAFGWDIAAMPLPASGGIILGQTLGILERRGYATLPRAGEERAHLLVEAWRRAYADRFLLGDPARLSFDPLELLSPGWLDARAASIDPSRATPSTEVHPWDGAARERAATTHLSVADAEGMSVALTTTINGWFGCGLYVPGAGFLLNNEMDDFVTAPGQPNMFGLIQGGANAVSAGARMLSSMTPTIAWRAGEVIVLGSPGGSRIPTATTQVLLRMIVDDLAVQTAIDRPRLHHQWLPDEVVHEDGALSEEVRTALVARGHLLKGATWHIGEVHVVRRRADGSFEAGADRRGPGTARVLSGAEAD